MSGRSLRMITDAPMSCPLEINGNTLQKVKVQFKWAGAKLAEAINRIFNIKTTSNIDIYQLTK